MYAGLCIWLKYVMQIKLKHFNLLFRLSDRSGFCQSFASGVDVGISIKGIYFEKKNVF